MITLQNISFWYHEKVVLFDQMDLLLEPGRIYGLLGKNGAGKTTLLKLLSGLAFAKSGTISVNGYKPEQRSPSFLSDIFLLPEEIYLPANSPEKMAKLYAPFYPAFDMPQFRDLLGEMDVVFGAKISKLSYGQKKKAMIAFALACNTRFVFLDEPTNGLDIPSKAVFRKIIASVFNEDRTILISTHQVKDLESLIDSVVILDGGKIRLNSPLEKISSSIAFRHGNRVTEGETVLFESSGVMGRHYLVPNTSGEEGVVDLEILFNAWVADAAKFNQIINN
jgi:ABC-2 type transport system ATP-binding protein